MISFIGNPQNRDILASLGILIASEMHGWGKGGSLLQTAMGYIAKFCARFSTPAHQAMVAEVLKAQGVTDLAADAGPAAAPAAQAPGA
jgi:hypothetical protein